MNTIYKIQDDHEIVSVKRYTIAKEYPEHIADVRFYDDGFGSLYVYRTTYGFDIVRAMSWETALDICRDEFCTGVNWDDLDAEDRAAIESNEGCEGYYYGNNGLVYVDDNEMLDKLTTEEIERLGLIIETKEIE